MEYDADFHLKIFDVGGDRGIRGIWSNYYGEVSAVEHISIFDFLKVFGVIYVIDYSTDETFMESIEVSQERARERGTLGLLLLRNVFWSVNYTCGWGEERRKNK